MPSISRSETERAFRSPSTEDDHQDAPATVRTAPPQVARRDHEAIDFTTADRDERFATSSDYAAFIANVTAAARVAPPDPARDAAVRAKLDAVRDAFSGPYLVDGRQVTARPMFRMLTHEVPQSLALAVDQLATRAGARAPVATRVGQGTPQDLVRITQALLDAGRLPPGPGDLAARIRRMQWDYGIGVDCAGYCKQALAASAERMPKMYPAGMESFRDLDRERAGSFAKIAIESARAGDLVTLDPIPPEHWGHNVVVYSRVTADAAKRAELGANGEDAREFLASAGPHHVFLVDSSWGAGRDGAEEGGFRRDTWIYDASSKTWGSFASGKPPRPFVSSADGPAGDAFHGAYRPR